MEGRLEVTHVAAINLLESSDKGFLSQFIIPCFSFQFEKSFCSFFVSGLDHIPSQTRCRPPWLGVQARFFLSLFIIYIVFWFFQCFPQTKHNVRTCCVGFYDPVFRFLTCCLKAPSWWTRLAQIQQGFTDEDFINKQKIENDKCSEITGS